MTLHDIEVDGLDHDPIRLASFVGTAVLIVNVASRCGLTPQYTGLEQLHEQYGERGFSVLGAPCNQFGLQEPGTAEEIRTFCSTDYGVTFPLTAKLDVNGMQQHPLFRTLKDQPDGNGRAGDVDWNFEKFLVSPRGEVVGRFRPPVTPEAPELIEAVEAALPRWETRLGSDVQPGDVVRVRGTVLTVTRVEPHMMREGMLALIEDTPGRWLKRPSAPDAEVEVLA